MNNKEFFAVFFLLAGLGLIVLLTLLLFGSLKYFLFALTAQILILGNLFVWKYFFKKPFFQKLIKYPLFLFLFYFFKFGVILLVFAIIYWYLAP